jgi:hypothetical protein
MMHLRQCPYLQGGSFDVSTCIFTDEPDGPKNDWSWVILNFDTFSPDVFIVDCSWHTSGASDELGMNCSISTGKIRAKPILMSS